MSGVSDVSPGVMPCTRPFHRIPLSPLINVNKVLCGTSEGLIGVKPTEGHKHVDHRITLQAILQNGGVLHLQQRRPQVGVVVGGVDKLPQHRLRHKGFQQQ